MFIIACVPFVIIYVYFFAWVVGKLFPPRSAGRVRAKRMVDCNQCGQPTRGWSYGSGGFLCSLCKPQGTLEDQFNHLMDTLHAEHDEACSPFDGEESLWPVA